MLDNKQYYSLGDGIETRLTFQKPWHPFDGVDDIYEHEGLAIANDYIYYNCPNELKTTYRPKTVENINVIFKLSLFKKVVVCEREI